LFHFERVEVVETSSPDWKSGVIAIIRHPQVVTTPWVSFVTLRERGDQAH